MPNKKISELNENLAPSGNDIFPVVHNGETMYQTLSGLTEFIGTGSTSSIDKVYFYTIEYNGRKNIPISDPLDSIRAISNAPFLFEGFGQTHELFNTSSVYNFYSELLFEVIEENGLHVDGLQFSSLTELQTWLSDNLESYVNSDDDGVYVANKFTVKMYGLRNSNYQKITKVRGINTFFSILKGKGSYWRYKVKGNGKDVPNSLYGVTASAKYVEPDILTDFMYNVYNHFLGTSRVTFDGYDTDSVKKTFWFTVDTKRYYNLFPINQITNPTADIQYPVAGAKRLSIDDSGTFANRDPKTMIATSIYLLDKGAGTFYHTNGNQFDGKLLDIDNNEVDLTLKFPIISKTGTLNGNLVNLISAIRVYHLRSDDGFDCFIIKPMGVDTLLIDYIENNENASLYGLFSSPNMRRPVVVKFNDNTKTNNKFENVGWRLMLDDYESFSIDPVPPAGNFSPARYLGKIGRYNKKTFRNFRFFYGYPDGTISFLSDDEVNHIINASGCPVKKLVLKKPIN